jgi:hypothetical protein
MFTRILRFFPYLLCIGAVFIIAGLSAPFLINRMVLADVKRIGEFEVSEISIDYLGLFSASGSLRLSSGEHESIVAPRIRLLYTPRGLLNRQLDALHIDGALLHLERRSGRIGVRGAIPTEKPQGRLDPREAAWPVAVNSLILRDCSITLHDISSTPMRTTLSGDLAFGYRRDAENNYLPASLSGSYRLSGTVAGAGSIDGSLQENDLAITATIDALRLVDGRQVLPAAVSLAESTTLSGTVALHIDLARSVISHLEGELEAGNYGVDAQTAHNFVEVAGPLLAIKLHGSPESLVYEIGPLDVKQPLTARAELSGTVSVRPGGIKTNGSIHLHDLALASSGLIIAHLNGSYQGFLSAEQGLAFHLDGAISEDSGFGVTAGDLRVRGKKAELSAQLDLRHDSQRGTASLKVDTLGIAATDDQFMLTDISADIELARVAEIFDARISADIAEVQDSRHGWYAKGIRLELGLPPPFSTREESKPGVISLAELGHRHTPLASCQASLTGDGDAMAIEGTVTALFDPALVMSIKGVLDPVNDHLHVGWQVPLSYLSTGGLAAVAPMPADLSVDGFVEARGAFERRDGSLYGSATLRVSDAMAADTRRGLSLGGINCAVTLPTLPALSTSPSQICSVNTASLGKLRFTDADITFRLEDARTLFIEKSLAGWCGGTLESGSLRLQLGNADIGTTLFASRINFAQLLKQFGFDDTEGDGSLNGRLPVRLGPDGLFFDDGFLFSTPGAGGIIKFNDTRILREAMASDLQTSNLAYAMSALEDFAYNWARISLNNEQEDVLLAMELDGKPRAPLPYSFNRDGILIRSDETTEGTQHPLRLDINLRLPLLEMVQWGQHINSLMGE